MFRAIMMSAVLALVVGCGSRVEVPPAYVGKVLTKNGYAPETIPPSKFRLPACFAYCDKLILLQANDSGFKETMTVFMPKDKLNLAVEVRGTLSIPTTPSIVDAIYDRVTSTPTNDGDTNVIQTKTVYETYGQQALRGIVRSEIVKYSIADVLEQREAIGGNIHAAIQEKMAGKSTPLIVSRFELADVQPPAVIVQAQQSAKEREIDIQRAEADAQVQMVEAEKALEIAKKDRLVEREKALAIAEQNEIASKSITPQVLEYKRLETALQIYTALASSSNTIIVPADASSFSNIGESAAFAKLVGKELK